MSDPETAVPASQPPAPDPAPTRSWVVRVFQRPDGQWRAVWRVAAFLATVFVVGFVLGELVRPRLPEGQVVRFLGRSSIALIAALAGSWVVTRMERRAFGTAGLGLHPGWWRDFVFGSTGGALLVLATAAVEAAGGALTLRPAHHAPAELLASGVVVFVLFLLAGTFEELMFRGVAFQALLGGLGAVWSVALLSVLFGLGHLGNPNVTAFSTINTVLAGVFLAIAYLRTRSLWLASGLHWSWNFTMGFVLGLPVSGMGLPTSTALEASVEGREWLSGGAYGPEGGAALTLVVGVACVWLARTRLVGLAPGMPVFGPRRAAAEPRPAPAEDSIQPR